MAGGAGANRARQSYNETVGQASASYTGHPGGLSPYDGPASQPSSQHGDPSRPNPFAQGLGYDPAKPTPAKPSLITNTRVELPAAAYGLDGGVSFLLSFCSSSCFRYTSKTRSLTWVQWVCSIRAFCFC